MAERDVIINLVVKGGDTSAQQLEKVAQSEQDVAVSAGQATKALDAQSKELNQNAQATAQVTKQNQSLKAQLKDIKLQLQQLAIAGKQNTAEYKKLRDEAGNLADAIGDVNDEIKQAGSDTKGFDKVIRVASTATAAFGLVEGAAALFGDENEELQKSLLKVNAAMTVLTSLQQIQEELSRKDSLFTAAAAKAKALYAAATAGATGALGAFRVALIATGIGAAVVAIGLLVANWDKLTAAIFGTSAALDEYNKQRELDQKKSKQQSDLNNAEIAALEAKARLLRSEGKIQEANLADQAVLNAKVREAERLLNEEKANQIRLEQQLAPKIAERTEEIKRQIVAAKNSTESFRGNTKSVEQLEKELRNVSRTIRNENKPAIDEANIALDAAQTAYDNAKAAANEYNNELDNKALEDAKKKQDAYNKALEDAKKRQEELAKQQKQDQQDILDNFADLEEAAKRYKDNLDAIGKSFEQGLSSTTGGITDLGKFISFLKQELDNLAPDDPQRSSIIKLIVETENQLKSLQDETDATAKFIKATLFGGEFVGPVIPDFVNEYKKQQDAIKQERINDVKDGIEKAQILAQGTLTVFRQVQAARLQILDNQLKQGLISEEEYQREIAKIRRKEAIAAKAQAIFDATLSGINAVLASLKFGPVFAGVVAALAAAQLAAIAATPIPKFRKGGDVDILKGGRERLGELFGNSHERGGILIEAEGGEHITRKTMAKKYRPLLHAINSDTVDTFLKPNTMAIPMHKRLSNSEIKSSRQAEKRMAELIEEVRFLSQYVRQGNKYAKVTADNTQDLKTAKKYHRV